jgi:molecular chaperone DnaK (HSP70)
MDQCKWLLEGEDKAIIDFGESGVSIAIIKLWQGTVEVKALYCGSHFGGWHFATCLIIEAR